MDAHHGYEPFDAPDPCQQGPKSTPGSIFTDGIPDDMYCSHVVMGTGNYYTTMDFHWMKVTILVIMAVVIIIALVMFAFGPGFSNTKYNEASFPPTPPAPNVPTRLEVTQGQGPSQTTAYSTSTDGQTIMSSLLCDQGTTTSWIATGASCTCTSPYWSGNCLRESYKPQYIPAGVAGPEAITLDIISNQSVDRLSYPKESGTSCTDLCDDDPNCRGVYWQAPDRPNLDPGNCTLFRRVKFNPGYRPNFDPNVDANLYVKEPLSAFEFSDFVVVYRQPLPRRWWINPRRNVLLARQGQVYAISFYPEAAHQGGDQSTLTGVYSIEQFSASQFQSLVAQGPTETVYIAKPGETLNVPVAWTSETIYVMYDIA